MMVSSQMDWDDLRVFLEVARRLNVRDAAERLGMHHSTVSRRVRQFEARSDMRLFERRATGLALTVKGEEMMAEAAQFEAGMEKISRRMSGGNSELAGPLKVTMPDMLLTHVLMPTVARFVKDYPDIELEIIVSYDVLEVGSRDADIALRSVPEPGDQLVGRRLSRKALCGYVARHLLEKSGGFVPPGLSWISRGSHTGIGIGRSGPVSGNSAKALPTAAFNTLPVQIEAARAGIGAVYLPCFLGDSDLDLVRLPGHQVDFGYDFWLLTHRDLIGAARVRAFFDAVVKGFAPCRDRMEGRGLQPAHTQALAG